MARFLHTADWQLGMRAKMLGEAGELVRSTRINTVVNLMKEAKKRSVDFIIVAGDVFESNAVDRDLIKRVVDILEEASPTPIYILPGNHDPLTPDSIYKDRLWKSVPPCVTILDERRPYSIEKLDVVLYPCPIQQKVSKLDPTAWMERDEREAGKIRIGIAHGTLDIPGLISDPNFPISPSRAEDAALDYLALGDWHSVYRHKSKDGVERIVYSGTPEPTAFGERNSGRALLVEIDRAGSPPSIEEIDCANLRWLEWEREIADLEQLATLKEELANVPEPQKTLLRMDVHGVAETEVHLRIDELRRLGMGTFLYFEMATDRLYLKPDIKKIKSSITGSIFTRTVEALEALMMRCPTLSGHVSLDPQVAEERLEELEGAESIGQPSAEVVERALSMLYEVTMEAKR